MSIYISISISTAIAIYICISLSLYIYMHKLYLDPLLASELARSTSALPPRLAGDPPAGIYIYIYTYINKY